MSSRGRTRFLSDVCEDNIEFTVDDGDDTKVHVLWISGDLVCVGPPAWIYDNGAALVSIEQASGELIFKYDQSMNTASTVTVAAGDPSVYTATTHEMICGQDYAVGQP